MSWLPLLLLLAPALAAPSDIDPMLRELFDNEPMPELEPPDLPFEDEDLRGEQKRSGLRAAMVARGGRGIVMRPGWQVGGDSYPYPALQLDVARRSQPPNKPYLNVGVLSDVDQYFNGLRDQLESMTDPPAVIQVHHGGMLREGPRPSSTAAYLHALRSHRPSHRVRSFVEDPGPVELRGANSHDPALLWAGLGRR